MSEYINNVSQRKEVIKNILRQLHEGKSVDEVKAEFARIARDASSTDIAQVEQMLISEGLAVEEVQNLCDVHVAVFRESLDRQQTPGSERGHPFSNFQQENRLLEQLLDEMNFSLDQYRRNPSPEALEIFRNQAKQLVGFECHYRRKENLLFPFLEGYGFTGPSKVMWGKHDEIRRMFKGFTGLLSQNPRPSVSQVEGAFAPLGTALREMVYKEEKILFPAAMEMLTEIDWAKIRQQEGEMGYFLLESTAAWQPKTGGSDEQPAVSFQPVAVEGELPLNTGALSHEQINLLLTNLPVDITFVDEEDTVRFFSQTKERIFERLPAIIGRKVQNCHPPQSLGRVQQILDDFRSGRKDVAEFWIQMAGKFIHIRYFALRDADGKYRGTIEVSQNIAPLRALEGEKRLLDDMPAK